MLLAGASGSGKSRLARLSGCPRVTLDDFYHEVDHPDLPQTLGIVDWDHLDSWDSEGALTALTALCRTGEAEVPLYDIAQSRRTGTQRLTLGEADVFIAEGVFAPEMVPRCQEAGRPVDAIWLDRPRTLSLILRFVRDVREHRKPVPVLIRRGLALWQAEPGVRRRAIALGCRPLTMSQAITLLTRR